MRSLLRDRPGTHQPAPRSADDAERGFGGHLHSLWPYRTVFRRFVRLCFRFDAIAPRADLIRLGRADVVITGGAEAALTPVGLAGFCAARLVGTQRRAGEGEPTVRPRSRWFRPRRRKRRAIISRPSTTPGAATVYCELLGCGQSADGTTLPPHPKVERQRCGWCCWRTQALTQRTSTT